MKIGGFMAFFEAFCWKALKIIVFSALIVAFGALFWLVFKPLILDTGVMFNVTF